MISATFLLTALPLLVAAQLDDILPTSNSSFNPFPYSPGFDIEAVAKTAKILPTHSWEYGSACEALLELHNPGTITIFVLLPVFLIELTRSYRVLRLRREPLPDDRPRLEERGCARVWSVKILRYIHIADGGSSEGQDRSRRSSQCLR